MKRRNSLGFDGASNFTASDHGGDTVVDDKTSGVGNLSPQPNPTARKEEPTVSAA